MKTYSVVGLALGVALSFSAEASVMRPIRQPTNSRLASLVSTLSPEWNKSGNCYKIAMAKVVSPAEAHGRSVDEVRSSMVKESLHRFSGAYMDDGIDMDVMNSSSQLSQDNTRNSFDHQTQGSEFKLQELMTEVGGMSTERNFVVYSGDASGKKTSSQLIAVYDVANSEIVSFVSGNFASASGCGDSAN